MKQGDVIQVLNAATNEEWVYEPRSPRIYDCQRVEPVLMAGKHRLGPGSPPPDVMAEAARRCHAFDRVRPRALAELAPLAATLDQKKFGPQSVPVDLPGLKGYFHTFGQDIECARAFYVDDQGRMTKRWSFCTEADGYYDDDGRIELDVVVAHGFRSEFGGFGVADWELVVRGLGNPAQVLLGSSYSHGAWYGVWKFGGHTLRILLLAGALETARTSAFGPEIREQERLRAQAVNSAQVRKQADLQRARARELARQAAVAVQQSRRHGRR